MRFTTEDGREGNVGISYREVEIPRYPGMKCRRTIMYLHCVGNSKHPAIPIEEWSTCSPFDSFSKKVGRQKARLKFLAKFRGLSIHGHPECFDPEDRSCAKCHFTRNDRRVIYQGIMPEWNHTKKRRSKRSIEETEDRVDTMAGIHRIEGDAVLHMPVAKDGDWHPTAG
jgi:hypothetical protein